MSKAKANRAFPLSMAASEARTNSVHSGTCPALQNFWVWHLRIQSRNIKKGACRSVFYRRQIFWTKKDNMNTKLILGVLVLGSFAAVAETQAGKQLCLLVACVLVAWPTNNSLSYSIPRFRCASVRATVFTLWCASVGRWKSSRRSLQFFVLIHTIWHRHHMDMICRIV